MRERVWIIRRMARKRQSPARACPVATRSSYSGETKKLEKVSLGWLSCSCSRLGDSRESCHLLSLLRNALYDTPLVPLSAKGDARFRGDIGPLSFACVSEPNLAFLIRTAGGAWIANGAIRLSGGRE